MEAQKQEAVSRHEHLNEANFVHRFLSNDPTDALNEDEITAVFRYLRGIIAARYGPYFTPFVLDDLAEDAFMEIYTARRSFKRKARLTTWMGTIARRVAYSHFEDNFNKVADGDTHEAKSSSKQAKDQAGAGEGGDTGEYTANGHSATGADKHSSYPFTVSYDTPFWHEAADEMCASEAELEDVRFFALLDEALRQLTPKEARAFQAIVVQEGEYDRYADDQNTTVTAVRSLVSDAKRKLRLILKDQLGLDEPVGLPDRSRADAVNGRPEHRISPRSTVKKVQEKDEISK